MLDLKFIKENLAAVKKNVADRFMTADPEKVVALYEERNRMITETEDLRRLRNENAQKMKGKLTPEERTVLIEEGKSLKDRIAGLEKASEESLAALDEEWKKIPNMAHPDAPVGKEDKDNLETKRSGTVPSFDFAALDHVQLAEKLDLIDFESATKVTGPKFYYLKNQAVFLEMALVRYAMDILVKKGFVPFVTPDMARIDVVEGTGFNPRGAESNIYGVEGTDLCLVGTAEITLGGLHRDELIDLSAGPRLYAGLSHCFRREAGAAGQFSKGLYRVHQFTKVEMFVFCKPEDSDAIHLQLRDIEEEIFSGLGIAFRVVDTCTGDLGAPAYRKFDLEAWMPGRGDNGDWGEVTSTSNCTDYQARRLNIRYKDETGKNRFVHTLNGTAIAISRGLVALLENYQQADGSIRIPEKLIPYTGFDRIG
jgi:seryl-tRNA synthetase